jgi:putative salt-induced outer membrane protein YdiY
MGQTIIDAEKLTGAYPDSTIYAITASYNGTRGNSITDRIEISPALLILRKKNDFKIFGGYSSLSQSENNILRSGFIHLRHNFKISKRIKTFEFFQLQFNDVLKLEKRQVYGGGLRFSLVSTDSLELDYNLGLMREVEVLNPSVLLENEIAESRIFRITMTGNFKWQISKVFKINNVIYYQPYLRDFGDFRILNDLNFSVSLLSHIDFNTSLMLRYDSKPPGTLEKLDEVMAFGLTLKF